MRILYVATIGGFMPFFKTLIRELIKQGHKVDIATNMMVYPLPEYYKHWGCGVYQISCSRSPITKGNFEAIKQLSRIVTENHYDIVHCHTPIAAACTRLACKEIRNNGTKVIYTAHGFHFYKGAPFKNWLIYFPAEWLCAHWTDVLITINKEDYVRAKKYMHAKQVTLVPGVGINTEKFAKTIIDRATKRREIGVPEDAILLLSVGELNKNKNHETVIKALCAIKDKELIEQHSHTNIYYIIAGCGDKKDELQRLVYSQSMIDRIKLLGFRTDVNELYKAADVFVFPSYREGLSVSLMEAMASGLPCCVSKIRGNVDLIDDRCGELFDPCSVESVREGIESILKRDRSSMAMHNIAKIKDFDILSIVNKMKEIYQDANE